MDDVKDTMDTVERVANYTSDLLKKIQSEINEKKLKNVKFKIS